MVACQEPVSQQLTDSWLKGQKGSVLRNKQNYSYLNGIASLLWINSNVLSYLALSCPIHMDGTCSD